nr:Chain K, FtsZ CTT [synthetic construct]5HAW_L Chain L, FtsZ CTT [synthetic construct]5HBU_K Chain K, FtsZ CTT peptide [synthetic construct]
DYLDIPAFLR